MKSFIGAAILFIATAGYAFSIPFGDGISKGMFANDPMIGKILCICIGCIALTIGIGFIYTAIKASVNKITT